MGRTWETQTQTLIYLSPFLAPGPSPGTQESLACCCLAHAAGESSCCSTVIRKGEIYLGIMKIRFLGRANPSPRLGTLICRSNALATMLTGFQSGSLYSNISFAIFFRSNKAAMAGVVRHHAGPFKKRFKAYEQPWHMQKFLPVRCYVCMYECQPLGLGSFHYSVGMLTSFRCVWWSTRLTLTLHPVQSLHFRGGPRIASGCGQYRLQEISFIHSSHPWARAGRLYVDSPFCFAES